MIMFIFIIETTGSRKPAKNHPSPKMVKNSTQLAVIMLLLYIGYIENLI